MKSLHHRMMLAVATAIVAGGAVMAGTGQAAAQLHWSYDNLMTRNSAPFDLYRDRGTSYGSYMYDSVIPRPRTAEGVYGLGSTRTYGFAPSNEHVLYCRNRFRSYSDATDSYLGYDGFQHRCMSPF